jgi:hypothetical protein
MQYVLDPCAIRTSPLSVVSKEKKRQTLEHIDQTRPQT